MPIDWQLCADVWRLIYAYLSNKDRANLIRSSPYFKDVFLEKVLKEYESSKELKEYQDWIKSADCFLVPHAYFKRSLARLPTSACDICEIKFAKCLLMTFANNRVFICKFCAKKHHLQKTCTSCNKIFIATTTENCEQCTAFNATIKQMTAAVAVERDSVWYRGPRYQLPDNDDPPSLEEDDDANRHCIYADGPPSLEEDE